MRGTIGLAVFAAVCGARVGMAGPLWSVGSGLTNSALRAVAHGTVGAQDLYVMVGDFQTIFTSTDGNAWSSVKGQGMGGALYGVAYGTTPPGQGLFVAVGEDETGAGTILDSTDGKNWTAATYTAAPNGRLKAVAYGVANGQAQFVAVGDNGVIITSVDGRNWSSPASYAPGADTRDSLAAVASGNGRFVAVGYTNGESFYWDGTGAWSQGGSGLGGLNTGTGSDFTGVAFGNGQFVAVDYGGGIDTSPDGNTWLETAAVYGKGSAGLSAIAYGNGLFVAVGENGGIFASRTGSCNWIQIESDTTEPLYGIAYGSGAFVAAGAAPGGENGSGTALNSTLAGIQAQPPQMNWTLAQYAMGVADTNDTLTGIAWGTDRFVAVGSDQSAAATNFLSPDGIQWVQGGSGLNDSPTGVAYGNGRFVAVDDSGATYTSSDGSTWTAQPGNSTGLSGVAYGGGAFVAVGAGGHVLTAPSVPSGNLSWTPVDSGAGVNLNGIAYASGQYLGFAAVGDNGTIITSYGLGAAGTWTVQNSNPGYNLYGVTYGSGKYAAVGDAGTILYSTDATTWTMADYNVTMADSKASGNALRCVAYGNGQFVAVGDNGWTVISPDGTHWIGQSSATVNDLSSIIYRRGGFIAVGASGTILESIAPGLTIARLPTGSVQITVAGGAEQVCQIESSPDLVTWNVLETVALNNYGAWQSTAFPATSASLFYRAIATPACP